MNSLVTMAGQRNSYGKRGHSSDYAENGGNKRRSHGSYSASQTMPQPPQSADEDCTLWIGNLLPWMCESYLYRCFADTDEVSSIEVGYCKKTEKPQDYGFLRFLTRQAAERFLDKYNGAPMPSSDEDFTLNWASEQALEEAHKSHLKQVAATAPDFKIYVGNLAYNVTRDLLLTTFRALYVSVKGGKVATNTLSGHCQGYGFVTFRDESEQIRAITEMNGVPCSSRPMRVGYTFQSVRRSNKQGGSTGSASLKAETRQGKGKSVAGKALKENRESVSEKKEDEPIYILGGSFRLFPYEQLCTFCYVIEEKNSNRNIEERTTPTPVINSNNNKLTNKGKCQLLRSNENETDSIRSLSLPSLSAIKDTHLLVFNSCLFLLGGADVLHYRNLPHSLVRFCDLNSHLKNDWVWQIGPCSNSPGSFLQATASNNGSIVIVGADTRFSHPRPLWLRSLSSGWENLPKPPRKLHMSFKTARLLAVTDTRILWVMGFKTSGRKCGVCFDLEEWKWHVFDKKSFNGLWSAGVVLFESYLFLYGVDDDNNDIPVYDNKSNISLHVYDLEQRHFLPDLFVTGHNQYEKVFPPSTVELFQSRLFKVNHNKLAIVWWEESVNRGKNFAEVHCTKFVIREASASSTNGSHKPVFHADVFSHQTYRIEGTIVNCMARVTMREEDERLERGRADEQCHEVIEQVSESELGDGEEESRVEPSEDATNEETSDGYTESITSDWEIGNESSTSEVNDAVFSEEESLTESEDATNEETSDCDTESISSDWELGNESSTTEVGDGV